MAPSWVQILIVVILMVLLFGRGKISDLMGDVAKGIKSFKKGMADDDVEAKSDTAHTIEHDAVDDVDAAKSSQGEKSNAG